MPEAIPVTVGIGRRGPFRKLQGKDWPNFYYPCTIVDWQLLIQSLIESLPLLVTLKVNVVGPKERVCEAECTELATRTAHNVMKKLPAWSKFALLAFCFFNRPIKEESSEVYNLYKDQKYEKYRCQYFVRRFRAPPDLRARAGKGNKNAIRIDRKLARCIVPQSDVIDYFCLHSEL